MFKPRPFGLRGGHRSDRQSVIRCWRYRDHFSIREISRRTRAVAIGPKGIFDADWDSPSGGFARRRCAKG
jgi:hypothetical protein